MSLYSILRVILVLWLTACSRTPSHAEFRAPWVHVFSSDALSAAYDTSRVAQRDDSLHVWTRWQYAEPEIIPDSSGTYDAVEMEFVVQCASHKVRDGKATLLSNGDSVWGSNLDNPVRDLENQGRGRVLLIVCRRLSDQ